MLFHEYADSSELPIANVSKYWPHICYSQIQKKALAVILGLKKVYQFFYGQNFMLVTDHKLLIALFGLTK